MEHIVYKDVWMDHLPGPNSICPFSSSLRNLWAWAEIVCGLWSNRCSVISGFLSVQHLGLCSPVQSDWYYGCVFVCIKFHTVWLGCGPVCTSSTICYLCACMSLCWNDILFGKCAEWVLAEELKSELQFRQKYLGCHVSSIFWGWKWKMVSRPFLGPTWQASPYRVVAIKESS